MNKYDIQRVRVENIKRTYPPGTRIELISMSDPYAPVSSGTKGTVSFVDDIGTIHPKHKGEHSAVFVECFYPLDMSDEEKFAVIFIDENGDYHIGRIRKLTPRECWRLQGFTDEQFDKAEATGLSDSRLYKMAGNAVTVNVISAVGQIIKDIEERSSETWKNTTEKKQ